MAQVRWSVTAGNDLRDIENFIARDSILHAIAFVDRIVESAETLLKNMDPGILQHSSVENPGTSATNLSPRARQMVETACSQRRHPSNALHLTAWPD
ncbi:MAG TPA: type II toxin-antitoxin system RelE/ParE family toxin [Nitrospira sp.]|nr:type II toxin-antitoxin system RelE/ParE family toxin [Nitrospira sp.]